jgi:23S rRNA (uracil1939-C5)-methyltransferase
LHEKSLDAAERFFVPQSAAVVDLYSGIGASLQRWRLAGAEALGVEFDRTAALCAQKNAPGATVLRGPCTQRLPQVQAWLDERPEKSACVYVNPPRTGLEPEVIAWLGKEQRLERLVYLSSSAGTLRRDLEALERSGWAVESLQPLDFSPQTHHVEVQVAMRHHVDHA